VFRKNQLNGRIQSQRKWILIFIICFYIVNISTRIPPNPNYTECGINNSHISKNNYGVPKAGSGVWSIPLDRVHNKVFSRRHAVVGWASRLCSGGFLKNFQLSGTVNKQNFRYWAAENPRELHEWPLHSPKVTVWCALSSIGVIEPYVFGEGGVTVTVNANRYCDVLENFLRPKIDEYGEEHNPEDFWFQQDGATAHTARRPRAILKEVFPGRVVS
jgi:hypothetical protein